jgi:hypothetical protein
MVDAYLADTLAAAGIDLQGSGAAPGRTKLRTANVLSPAV